LNAAAVLCAVATLGAERSGVLVSTETATVAARAQLRPAHVPDDVAVVGIDAATFSDLQRAWPFPRRLHARVIDRLHEAGARRIVFDVQFTEPTRPADDLALLDAVGRARGTVLATTESDAAGRTNVLGGDANLRAAGAHPAASNVMHDAGLISRYPAEIARLRSLPFVTAQTVGAAPSLSSFHDGRAWIDYRGPAETISTISYSDVLHGRFSPDAVAGRVVVVGPTAPTFQDRHDTPVGRMSGAELQANAIWTALHGNPLRSAPAWVAPTATVIAAVVAPLLALLLGLGRTAAAAIALGAAYAGAAQGGMAHGIVLPPAGPLIALAAGLLAAIVGRYACAIVERRRIAVHNAALDAEVRRRTQQLRDTQLEILQRLGHAAEWRDQETGAHIRRIGTLARRLGLAVGLTEEEAEMLEHASALHDLGKVGVPDSVLLKPGRLEPEERAVMERHAEIGAEILAGSSSPVVQTAEAVARTHHERWDGGGSPAGGCGPQIPLAGRICAICDVFDALISERRYKRAWSVEEALDHLQAERGRHFDPYLVDAFVPLARELFGGGRPADATSAAAAAQPELAAA
jgi:CHASE2 domain-containing sensor protein